MDTFLVVWISLIAALPVSIALLVAVQKWCPGLQFSAVMLNASLAACIIVSAVFGIRFTHQTANVLAFILAYFSYCYLAVSAWLIRNKFIRFATMALACIPMAMGYLLATLGLLALVFIVGEWVSPPVQIQRMNDNLYCATTTWGMAASDSGYTVHLYKHWAILPFLEKEVLDIVVNETIGAAGANCHDAITRYCSHTRC